MFQNFLSLDSVAYTKLVQISAKSGSLVHGKFAHAHIIKTAFKPCLFLLNNLLNMYCKLGEIDTAHKLFDRMPERSVISYNLLISGYADVGSYENAISLFREAKVSLLKLDKFSYAGVLTACGQSKRLLLGKVIHGMVIVWGLSQQVFFTNLLIDMYCKCGRLEQARLFLEYSFEFDKVSWNSLISGHVRLGDCEEMSKILNKMHQTETLFNAFTLGSALKSCFHVNSMMQYGRTLHAYALKLGLDYDVVVATALLDMYAKTGYLEDAIRVFRMTPNQSVVMYNSMLAGLIQTENSDKQYMLEAFNIFTHMQREGLKPSDYTFSIIVKICNAVGSFEYGKQIHALICKNNIQSDEFVGSALIEMYSIIGSTEDQLKCFSSTAKSDIVSWTSMIAGYARNGQFESASSLFYELLATGMKPDEFIISSMMSACADLAAERSGEQVQVYAVKTGIWIFTVVQNSQISMYAKSGNLDSAKKTFDEMQNPDEVSWSVMICSYGQHGCVEGALQLFESMKNWGIPPNPITFLGVLTACSHGGLVEEGLRYYESMWEGYGVKANVRHCACVVDLLSRAGKLEDAETYILKSGFEDNPVMWRALLSACRVYKDNMRGKRVAEKLIELEPQESSAYVLLYNIYKDAGMESPAKEARKLMENKGVKEEPGQSWIETGNKIYSFVVGDTSNPLTREIYEKLEEIMEKIRKEGYVAPKAGINYHSEKLAVAFGLISLPASAPVKVMKNLRVCVDCHTTMKLISKVERRELVLRDSLRFHHFRDGFCSCNDHW